MNLFINTAYNNIEFYVFKDGYGKLYSKESSNSHTVVLYEVLAEVLNGENIELKDIDNIYVVNGPGSFTGLRVGVVFAKSLALENSIPIYPVNLLDVIYYTNNEPVAVDARGNKFFVFDGVEYSVLSLEEVEDKGISSLVSIKYDNLVEYLSSVSSVDVLDVSVNYMKEVL